MNLARPSFFPATGRERQSRADGGRLADRTQGEAEAFEFILCRAKDSLLGANNADFDVSPSLNAFSTLVRVERKSKRQIKWPKKAASQEQEATNRRSVIFALFAPFVLFRTGKGRTSSFWEAFAEAKEPNADKATALVLFHGHIFG
jgi:hypothetical protein